MADIRRLLKEPARKEMVEGLSWARYRKFNALNCSTLVKGDTSMRALKWEWDHPGFTDSAPKQWGRAIHCILLESKLFNRRFKRWDGRRQGKKYEEFAAKASKQGAEVLSATQYDSVLQASLEFVRHKEVSKYIKSGVAEISLFSQEHGIQTKGRLDWVTDALKSVTDVKTASSIKDDPFGWDFFKFHYDIKLGMYQRWFIQLTGLEWPVDILCLENQPPYDAAVVPVPQAILDSGVEKGMELYRQARECIDNDYWPGVCPVGNYPLKVPHRVMVADEERGAPLTGADVMGVDC